MAKLNAVKHEFSIILGGQSYQIQISPKTKYGWFEHNELGDESGGGLWFDRGMCLIDYDGVYELPSEVKDTLIRFGYIDPLEAEEW
jgi:hypothetical protein